MKSITIGLLCLAVFHTASSALEISLTITERAGIDRVSNYVNAGIPFPKGAVHDVNSLGLFTDDGKAIPAAFVVRQSWLEDKSIRWATVHFLADVLARGTKKYVLRDTGRVAPNFPIKVDTQQDTIIVDTGAIKFKITKKPFNLFDEIWYSPSSDGKYGMPILQSGKAHLVANIASGSYKVVNKKASVANAGESSNNTFHVRTLEVEENSPGRVVVKITGQLEDKNANPTLDFVARVYALSASSAIRVSFSLINRTGKKWEEFHGVNELSLYLPVTIASPLKYTVSQSEGDDLSGTLGADEKLKLLQPYSEHYFVSGIIEKQGKAKSILTRRLGWADITGATVGVCAGIRYFWQMHPKAITLDGNGTIGIHIVPLQEKPVDVPKGITSQADTRIDFFTGAARTHEFLIAFHRPDVNPASAAMAVVDPLLAVCSTSWYCQNTRVEGLLWDSNVENFKVEYRELISEYQKKIDLVFNESAGTARRGGKRGTEEYGFFSFGAGTESKGEGFISPNDWLNTRWDGNYYDFPRAVLVNFWRTGELRYWDVAQDSALHLADVDIAHYNPSNPKLNGIEHTCPNRGHFRQWWGGEPFGVSGNMDSTKSESLYDLYHMTGDAWFLDCALLVAQYSMNHTGGSLRAIANRAKNLIEAYEQTGEKNYLDEAIKWLEKTLVPRGSDKAWDQNWMYGMASEVLMDIYRKTGNIKFAQSAVNCCDSLINCYWKDDQQGVMPLVGFTLISFGHAYELTGNELYLKKGLLMLKKTIEEYAGSTKTFAQAFRISPYFLHYLSKEYQPPIEPVVKTSNAKK